MAVEFNVEDHAPAVDQFRQDLAKLQGSRGMLMQALHMAQNRFGHIPPPIQEIIAQSLKVPMSTVYGVITFYSRFTLVPKGKCEISICMGTACYIQGATSILQECEKALGIQNGETTEDGLFSLSTTRCVGACGLAPVVTINQEVHGRMNAQKMRALLTELKSQYGKESQEEEEA